MNAPRVIGTRLQREELLHQAAAHVRVVPVLWPDAKRLEGWHASVDF